MKKKWDFEIFDEIRSGFEHGNQEKIEKIFLKFFSIVTFHEIFQNFKKKVDQIYNSKLDFHATSFTGTDLNGNFHTFFGVFWEIQKIDFVHRNRGGVRFGWAFLGVIVICSGVFFFRSKTQNQTSFFLLLYRLLKEIREVSTIYG